MAVDEADPSLPGPAPRLALAPLAPDTARAREKRVALTMRTPCVKTDAVPVSGGSTRREGDPASNSRSGRRTKKRRLSFPPGSGATPAAAVVTTASRPKKRRRLVKFQSKATVLGHCDAMDRACTPPEIFSCDGCGRTLEAGLRGFEVYASCVGCEEYDLCFACCDNPDAARRRVELPRKAAHLCAAPKFAVVDRNEDVRAAQDGGAPAAL